MFHTWYVSYPGYGRYRYEAQQSVPVAVRFITQNSVVNIASSAAADHEARLYTL